MAPIGGFYDPVSYTANAIDASLFVLIIGDFLGVVNRTGAINIGITWAINAMKGREIWMIPILMTLFAAGGTPYGMAEETLPFYALIIPVVIAAGFDAMTGHHPLKINDLHFLPFHGAFHHTMLSSKND